MPIAPARIAAFDILQLVEGGGYASDLLLSRTADLDSRDAGLASEIVFGVLRYRAQLDYLIAHYAGQASQARCRGAQRAAHGDLPASLPGADPSACGGERERGTGAAGAQELGGGLRQRGPSPGGSRPGDLALSRGGVFVSGVAAGALGAPLRRGGGDRDRAGGVARAGEVCADRRRGGSHAGYRLAIHRAAAGAGAGPEFP